MSVSANENIILEKLAIVMVDNPRGTMKDIAEAVGISKATLHRTYGTRENLEKILFKKSCEAINQIVSVAENSCDDYKKAIRELINAHYENKAFIRFICSAQLSIEDEYWVNYSKALDSFFLKGQKCGIFKVDFSVQAMSEIFTSTIYGMIDAERRGRVATNNSLETIENIILYGIANINKNL